jgi:hypothetical protein
MNSFSDIARALETIDSALRSFFCACCLQRTSVIVTKSTWSDVPILNTIRLLQSSLTTENTISETDTVLNELRTNIPNLNKHFYRATEVNALFIAALFGLDAIDDGTTYSALECSKSVLEAVECLVQDESPEIASEEVDWQNKMLHVIIQFEDALTPLSDEKFQSVLRQRPKWIDFV